MLVIEKSNGSARTRLLEIEANGNTTYKEKT